MDKRSLSFLAKGAYNPYKDQMLLHAICNTLGLPYAFKRPPLVNEVSLKICNVWKNFGVNKPFTVDFGHCSDQVRSLLDYLVRDSRLTIESVQENVRLLPCSLYDEEYMMLMGPL